MQLQNLPLSKLLLNSGQLPGVPKNPRFIKDDRYAKLLQSIKDDPEMLDLRELIAVAHNGKYVVIAGNMRLRALRELGFSETAVKVLPADTDPKKLRAYATKDNVPFGAWDWEVAANEWDAQELEEWGVEMPGWKQDEVAEELNYDDLIGEGKDKPPTMKITFESPEQLQKAEIDIRELIDRKYEGAYFSVSAGDI